MGTLDPEFISKLSLSPDHAATLKKLGEYKGKYGSIEGEFSVLLDELKKLAKIESIESSNRLEGIIVEHSRIEEISLRSSALRGRSEQEVAGYRDALDMIHTNFEDMELHLALIRDIHEMIFSYTPIKGGSWKKRDNFIIERAPEGSRIRFKPVSAGETPAMMDRLMSEWNMSYSLDIEPLITIPIFMLDLLCVHPFPDGNGRVSRLVSLFLLYRSGFNVGRYISLERIAEESKVGYYNTLYVSSQGWHQGKANVIPWLEYFWGTLLRAYKELEERLATMSGKKGEKGVRIRRTALSFEEPFSISELHEVCPDVSRDMVRFVIREMRDDGLLVATGVGRGAKWMRSGNK